MDGTSPLLDDSPETKKLINRVGGDVDEFEKEPQLYRRRWVMLAILTLLTAENLTQWLFYSAISNIVMYHYNVSSFLAQLLSLNNIAVILIFGLPSIFVVNKTDLKAGCLISGVLSLIALWIKFFGAGENGFHLTLCGQIIASFGTCFVLPLPAQLASMWFGIFERSTATSVAASGLSFGMGFAYLFAVHFVPDSKNHKAIENGIQLSVLVQAMICSITVVAAVAVFEKKPPAPPSPSQAAIALNPQPRMTYLESIRLLFGNRSYIFAVFTFGIITGVLYSFFSLLSEIVLSKTPVKENIMGWMGILGSVIGIPGMILAGFWLDTTKSFKKSFIACSALIAVITLSFTFAIMYSAPVWVLFILVGCFGFFASALTTMGFVLGGELTYPVPEVLSSGVLLTGGQFFGVILLGFTSYAITAISVNFVNFLLAGACFVAFLFTPFVKSDFRRLAEDVTSIVY